MPHRPCRAQFLSQWLLFISTVLSCLTITLINIWFVFWLLHWFNVAGCYIVATHTVYVRDNTQIPNHYTPTRHCVRLYTQLHFDILFHLLYTYTVCSCYSYFVCTLFPDKNIIYTFLESYQQTMFAYLANKADSVVFYN